MSGMSLGGKQPPTVWLCAALAVLTLLVFWPATRAEFINYDDPDYVTENPHIQSGLNWNVVRWAFTSGYAGNWHPLTWLSHALDISFFGLNPQGHHTVNVVLHALNAVLVFLLFQQLTGARWRSALVAALFALHPLRVESVAWVSERKDVLCAFFGLLCLIAYAKYALSKTESGKQKAETKTAFPSSILHPLSSRWYWFALLCFALGLLSKPMLVTWPCVMLLLDLWPLQRIQLSTLNFQHSTLKRLLIEKLPFFGLSVLSCIITYLVQQRGGAMSNFDVIAPAHRLGNAVVAYARYLQLTFWPDGLAPFYPYGDAEKQLSLIFAVILIAVISAGVWRCARSKPYLGVGWLWFLGTLVPVIGIVQVGGQSLADRYTYLPSIGLFTIITWGVAELQANRNWLRPALAAVSLLVIGGLAIRAHAQVQLWHDSLTLFQHALRVTERNYIAHQNVGSVLAAEGKVAEAEPHFAAAAQIRPNFAEAFSNLGLSQAYQGKLDTAIENYQKALAIDPRLEKVHFNLGRARSLQGKPGLALPAYEQAVKLNPGYHEARNWLATTLADLNELDRAETEFHELLRQQPQDALAHFNLGNLFVMRGRTDDARREFETALALNPNDADAHQKLGMLLAQQHQTDAALQHFRAAVRLAPSALNHYNLALALVVKGDRPAAVASYRQALEQQPDLLMALNDLAWQLATAPEHDVRDGVEAVRLAEKANDLTQRKEARCWGTLDAAYAEAGRFDDAIRAAEKCRELATTTGQTEVAEAATKRLELYRTRKPFRQLMQP